MSVFLEGRGAKNTYPDDVTLLRAEYVVHLLYSPPAQTRHQQIQTVNVKSLGAEYEVVDGERLPLAAKDLGACDLYPQVGGVGWGQVAWLGDGVRGGTLNQARA